MPEIIQPDPEENLLPPMTTEELAAVFTVWFRPLREDELDDGDESCFFL